MGLVYANIDLKNPRNPESKGLSVSALVDTGAITLCIPRRLAVLLDLQAVEQREVTAADGERRKVDYVGPLQVRFGDRSCFTGALVLGDDVLLGAVPLEDMDLVVHPRRRLLTVNPASPNIPSVLVKGAVEPHRDQYSIG